MQKRSNLMVGLGLAVFVLGAAMVLLVVKDDGDSAAAAQPRPGSVVVATGPIAAGTSGDDAVARGLVRVQDVDAAERAADAVPSTAALAGTIFRADVPEGGQVTTSALRGATLRGQSIAIPEGKRGVAVEVDFVDGVAGYVGPGDQVDVYATVTNQGAPTASLVLSNVDVLDVSTEVAPRRASAPGEEGERPSGATITYLLALDPVQAEQVIFLATNESLYLTLAPDGAPPVATPGRTYDNALAK